MNEEENLNPEMNPEEIENKQELQQEAKSNATNTKVVTAGAKAAANYFAPGVGGKVVDIASKTKIGNDILNAGGQVLTGATKAMPFGDKIQDTLNTADDAGAIDMASQALDMAGGGASGAASGGTAASGAASSAGAAGSNTSSLNNLDSASSLLGDSNDSSSLSPTSKKTSIDLNIGPMKSLKFYLIGAVAFIIVIVILMFPHTTLNLTDGDSGVAYAANYNLNLLTDEQIEKSLIYVGDSRILGMKNALNKNHINYIAETEKGYYWFDETAKYELSAYISANTQKFVVLAFGVNDLANIDKYIVIYNALISTYNNAKFYFMSVNPVNEELTTGVYSVTNSEIEAFNQKLSSTFGDSYIDVYKEIKDSYETDDGLHYRNETYTQIHNIVIKYIKERNSISFLGSYPSVNESKALQGISITAAIGDLGVENLSSYINSQINIGGKCTGAGVAGAATGLIYGLHQQGYHLPYYYGGGHGYNNGINLNWGTEIAASYTSKNTYKYSGLDCSGFIAWAMNTAGVSGGTIAGGYTNYGKSTTFEQLSPGDLLDRPGNSQSKDGHVIMVIENKGTYLQCAESTGGGVQFTTITRNDITESGYKMIDMDEYYQNNCTHT